MHCFMMPALALGARGVLLPAPDPEALIEAIAAHGATSLFAPPTVWIGLLAHPRFCLPPEEQLPQDGDGHITIVDRKKDMINTGGENVSSREVEEVLFDHPAVGEVAVIAVPDERWIEAVCAVVVVRDGVAAQTDELRARSRANAWPGSRPRSGSCSPTRFPRTRAARSSSASCAGPSRSTGRPLGDRRLTAQRPAAYPCDPRGLAPARRKPSERATALNRPSRHGSTTTTSCPRRRSSATTAGSIRLSAIIRPGWASRG
jgi:hypothetical protein